MKRLVPTEFELSLKADREHAARGAAMHKQKPLAVNIHDDKQRIRELEAALKPFAELDTVGEPDNNHVKRYVLIADVRRAAAILKGAK